MTTDLPGHWGATCRDFPLYTGFGIRDFLMETALKGDTVSLDNKDRGLSSFHHVVALRIEEKQWIFRLAEF